MKTKYHSFDKRSKDKPVFVIDTPPPFTSGSLHIGRAYGCILSDITARYKRMRGYNVLMPQGWDTQGLPTELSVQRKLAISTDRPEAFKAACREWTGRMIQQMRKTMMRLGYMPDWSFEYKTMDEDYHRRVQLALLNLYHMGRAYRERHPVYWCPKCKTTLAQAEIGYVERRGILAHLRFKVEDSQIGHIEIATTRPELLHACVAVAVHPKDNRYQGFVGKTVEVPLYNQRVPIIADETVEPAFGTGAVMICTFGDAQDARWILKHSLPIIEAIGENGQIINSQKYDGLTVMEAREAILTDLKALGVLSKTEDIRHRVLAHTERTTCRTPIELLAKKQWFIRILDLKDNIMEMAQDMAWFPEHMRQRLIDWVKGLGWDWAFSRQRAFGTPIPFWYCQQCDQIIPPERSQLPIDPLEEKPPIDMCPRCGGKSITGATDVCDCWIDSSITPLIISGWPDDISLFRRLYPADLRQQGSEIIRTWAFYTMTQCHLQTGLRPFKAVLVNGMILGPDGRAMSSSLGNVIDPMEVIKGYGADALRQALLMANIGSDFLFEWKHIQHTARFLQKFWNTARFAQRCLKHYRPSTYPIGESNKTKDQAALHIIDRWILSRLQHLIQNMTESMESYQFHRAVQAFQAFVWHEFCDHYLEFVKYRFHNPKRPWMKHSSQYALHHALWALIRLYAPIAPFITEEIYQRLYRKRRGYKTIHEAPWPTPQKEMRDERAEEAGETLTEIISAIRKFKSQHNLPLNAEIPHITIAYKGNVSLKRMLLTLREEIANAGKVRGLALRKGEAKGALATTHRRNGKIQLTLTQ
ncbi:MAG: Isoleucine--tRNA ligase [Candidatus Bathyarchaeota archaeon BA1]|nr:MAG: Isoleucine--tRNA ligase [Candidatus Bathyarchaeota archaeon BA1]